MNDSNENASSERINEQLEAAICTVLHYQVILPSDFGTAWEDGAVEKLSEQIKNDIIVWSKENKGARLLYNAASQLPDGMEIPLL
jgi:hypothetical protein